MNPNGPPVASRPPLTVQVRPKGTPNKVTRARVETELRHIAFSDPKDLFERLMSADGKRSRTFTLREICAMPESIRRAISSVKVRTENLKSGDGEQDTTVEIKFWDKVKALELIGKYLRMFDVHVVVEGLDERKAKLREAFTRAQAVIDVTTPAELAPAVQEEAIDGER